MELLTDGRLRSRLPYLFSAWTGLTSAPAHLNSWSASALELLEVAGRPEPGGALRSPLSSRLTWAPYVLQEEHREAKLTLRPPSLAAPYAPVQSWQHQPEKLIFESCGYEANVSNPYLQPRAPMLFSALQPSRHCGEGSHGRGSRSAGQSLHGDTGHLNAPTARSHSIWAPC